MLRLLYRFDARGDDHHPHPMISPRIELCQVVRADLEHCGFGLLEHSGEWWKFMTRQSECYHFGEPSILMPSADDHRGAVCAGEST